MKNTTEPSTPNTVTAPVPYTPRDVERLLRTASIRIRPASRGTATWRDPDVRAVRRAIKTWRKATHGLRRRDDYAVLIYELLWHLERQRQHGLIEDEPSVVLANALNADGAPVLEVVVPRHLSVAS